MAKPPSSPLDTFPQTHSLSSLFDALFPLIVSNPITPAVPWFFFSLSFQFVSVSAMEAVAVKDYIELAVSELDIGGSGCGGGSCGDGDRRALNFEEGKKSIAVLEMTDKPVDGDVIIKEEQELVIGEGGSGVFGVHRLSSGAGGGCGSGSLSWPTTDMAKPVEGLYESGPPPFLIKTFEMVEDPGTDPIVSWSVIGDSFVVWDPHKFSLNILPNYFKHRNLSSFIRQLNTYGFRKVHLERWEFANSGFQRGKKHLLKSIKRRNHGSNNNNAIEQQIERGNEVERLKKEQDMLKMEIWVLRQQQENTDKHVASMEERVRSVEWKQRQMLMLIAKAMKRASFVQQLIPKYREIQVLGTGEISKKRRLVSNKSIEISSLLTGTAHQSTTHHKEELGIMQSEMNSILSSAMDVSSPPFQERKSCLATDISGSDLSSGNDIMWEKLMEDDVIFKDDKEVELLAGNNSRFVHELEDLIMWPFGWGGYATEILGDVGCPAIT
ncbi:hypothetical protein Nepgr_005929 [Nepenthes gracilis]|uniref:HSF-type DNA-binding domain-containing protein n=1 Tax=Nepenthes gracilis TaxID=150966 RepID=A0AAD3S434_NEPGR|nr:hypothetical protein Nepgr_005929 [Nepenthes gracilis]